MKLRAATQPVMRDDPVMQAVYDQYAANEVSFHDLEASEVEGEGALDFPAAAKSLFMPKRFKVIRGGRGGAKCLAVGTLVTMADGSYRAVEAVKVGDQVMGPDSLPRNVLATTRGRSMLYRVSQTSAESYVVNEDHILMLRKSQASIREGRYADWANETPIAIKDAYRQSKRWMEHFRGFRAGCLEMPYRKVRISPYILGLWLGDGTSRELRFTTMDPEIVAALEAYAVARGGELRASTQALKSAAQNYGMFAKRGRSNPIWDNFLDYDLKENKHIPEAYLSNSEEARLQLLAGLIDTDGSLHSNGYSICQVSERMARDIKRLADQLGFRTSLRLRKTHCTNNGVRGQAWYVSISGAAWRIPCKVAHKQIKREDVRPNKDHLLSQIGIRAIGEGDYAGFTLDGDHLFVLADGTVTHNSWTAARALLIQAANRPLRICCFREIQKNIKESVHQLLKDQIEKMGLQQFYEVQEEEIRGANGSLIIFAGLGSQTAASIKSFEGLDIAWVEEAQGVRRSSWGLLLPTLRKHGSEIWITFNPELETDPTYEMFVTNAPDADRCLHITMSWRDNPWFAKVLQDEMLHARKTMKPDEFNHVWGGQCRNAVMGAIYADEISEAIESGRITHVPYDRKLRVQIVLDLGWNDKMFAILAQKGVSEMRVIGAIQTDHETIDKMLGSLRDDNPGFNWGQVWLPHDGAHGDFKTGKTTHMLLREQGWKTGTVPNVPVETGIKRGRLLFERTYFDKKHALPLITGLRRYKRNQNPKSEEFMKPLHDDASHPGDAWRYLALCAEKMKNHLESGPIARNNLATYPIDRELGL